MSTEPRVAFICDECSTTIETIEPKALVTNGFDGAFGFSNSDCRVGFWDEETQRHLCEECRSTMKVECEQCSKEMEYHECVHFPDDTIWCQSCHEEAALIEQGIDVETDALMDELR